MTESKAHRRKRHNQVTCNGFADFVGKAIGFDKIIEESCRIWGKNVVREMENQERKVKNND